MEIKKKKKKNILFIPLIVILIGLITYLLYVFFSDQQDVPTSTISETEKTSTRTTEKKQPEGNEGDPFTDKDSGVNDKTNTSKNATISVPSYQALDSSITVNVAIDKILPPSAQCIMDIIGPVSSVISDDVFSQAQISGCQLVAKNIPEGSYEVNVYVQNNESKTNTVKLNIDLKKQ